MNLDERVISKEEDSIDESNSLPPLPPPPPPPYDEEEEKRKRKERLEFEKKIETPFFSFFKSKMRDSGDMYGIVLDLDGKLKGKDVSLYLEKMFGFIELMEKESKFVRRIFLNNNDLSVEHKYCLYLFLKSCNSNLLWLDLDWNCSKMMKWEEDTGDDSLEILDNHVEAKDPIRQQFYSPKYDEIDLLDKITKCIQENNFQRGSIRINSNRKWRLEHNPIFSSKFKKMICHLILSLRSSSIKIPKFIFFEILKYVDLEIDTEIDP